MRQGQTVFIEQMAEEFVAAMKLYHRTYGQSSWITDWDSIGTHSIIDSKDGGVTGYSAYDYVATGVNLVLDHPEYYNTWHLWLYEWDKSQPWKLAGQSGVPMQHLLIAVPEERTEDEPLKLTVKKLEAGTNKPMSGVTFSVKSADGSGDFSVTRATGADGTLTLTDADGLTAGQYTITEETVPEGYVAQTASQLVTVLPNSAASSVFTFYNEPERKEGDGSIRKVDADDPTKGIAGAVIKLTSIKLDDGGSFTSEYITKDGGYILKEEKTLTGYVMDESTRTQSVKVNPSDTQYITVYNTKIGGLTIIKKDEETGERIKGVQFEIRRLNGEIVGTYTTDTNGVISLPQMSKIILHKVRV